MPTAMSLAQMAVCLVMMFIVTQVTHSELRSPELAFLREPK